MSWDKDLADNVGKLIYTVVILAILLAVAIFFWAIDFNIF